MTSFWVTHGPAPCICRLVNPAAAPQIDQDMTALLNMADAEFSFQNKGKIYHPQWYAPEGEHKMHYLLGADAQFWRLLD